MPIAAPTYRAEAIWSSSLLGYFAIGTGTIGVDKIGGEFSDQGWTDITTNRLLGFETRRGREDELSGISPGTLTADLRDADGALDPENASGPYYPNIKPLRRFRIVATYNGVDYPLAYGFVTNYQAQPSVAEADVSLEAADLFTRMGRKRSPIEYPGQQFHQRIGAMLDTLQWPTTALRALDASTNGVPTETIGDQPTMLQHIDDVLKVDRGLFFVAGDGTVTYHNRHRRLSRASRGTFGFGGIPILAIEPSYSDAGIINEARVKRTAGVEQFFIDSASVGQYDYRTWSLTGTAADYLNDDGLALGLATWIVKQRKDPNQRISSITLVPELAPDTLWPHVLGAELGDLIVINHDRPGTKGIASQSYFIESIRHTWSVRSGHRTTWQLSRAPANTNTYFLIGSGRIGVEAVAY